MNSENKLDSTELMNIIQRQINTVLPIDFDSQNSGVSTAYALALLDKAISLLHYELQVKRDEKAK